MKYSIPVVKSGDIGYNMRLLQYHPLWILRNKLNNLDKSLRFHFIIMVLLMGMFGHSFDLPTWWLAGKAIVSGGNVYKTPYAYPPFWAIWCGVAYFLYSLTNTLVLFNIVVKLPIYFAHILIAKRLSNLSEILNLHNKKRVLEQSILWNPFIIFIGEIWGMFDVIVAYFVIESLYQFYRESYHYGWIALGVGVALKYYPGIIFLPILAYYAKNKNRGAFFAMPLFFIPGLFAWALSVYVESFHGFIKAGLAAHLDRPPYGANIFAVLRVLEVVLCYYNIDLSGYLLFVSFLFNVSLLLMVILNLFIIYMVLKNKLKNIFDIFYISLINFYIFTPVLNEQYLVAMVSLSIVKFMAQNKHIFIQLENILYWTLMLNQGFYTSVIYPYTIYTVLNLKPKWPKLLSPHYVDNLVYSIIPGPIGLVIVISMWTLYSLFQAMVTINLLRIFKFQITYGETGEVGL